MGLKIYAALGIALAFILLGSAFLIERERVKVAKAEGQAAVANVVNAVQTATVAQGEQNKKAVKKASAGSQAITTAGQAIHHDIEAVKDPKQKIKVKYEALYFRITDMFDCGLVFQSRTDCEKQRSVLPEAGQTRDPESLSEVTVDELLDRLEMVVSYSGKCEQMGIQCYEDSMKQDKK